ncbi:MAG: N-acetylmuramoyl-L-alanine amidase [bacterium]|nr:N-acetylmuramoyl-L-alanine amidase [bacterium]
MRTFTSLIALVIFLSACAGDSDVEPTTSNSPTTTLESPATTATTQEATTTTKPPVTTTVTTSTTTTVPTPLGVPAQPDPPPAPPAPSIAEGFSGLGVVTIAAGGAALYEQRDGEPFVVAREGLVFAAHSMQGDWIEVFTSCDAPAWVQSSQVRADPPAVPQEPGGGFDFSRATIVVDPGHGGSWNTGAVSPAGLVEKTVNLDISRRVADLLNSPHTIDWATGEIFVGEEVPAAGWVLLTRVGDEIDGDYEAGLIFRSDLANVANADAMVAVHNNAGWEIRLPMPGSDVYYQSQIPESRRFARIMVEEMRRSFSAFEASWVGAIETGAKSRLSAREGHAQYYGILRRSEMPTVIAEGAYIANESEADLLATPEFRQAYAEAIYRALIRFLTTDDTGSAEDSDPEIWAGTAGSGDARPDCEIPTQG